jgi:RNA polymerase-binding protein
VSSGSAIRGWRPGAGPAGPQEPDHSEAAPRVQVSFWCADRHETQLGFAVDAVIPETWQCRRCGSPAGRDVRNPPLRLQAAPYKTHLAYVKERRSAADGEAILAEALARLRGAAPAAPRAQQPPTVPGGGSPAGHGNARPPAPPDAGGTREQGGDADPGEPPGRPRQRRRASRTPSSDPGRGRPAGDPAELEAGRPAAQPGGIPGTTTAPGGAGEPASARKPGRQRQARTGTRAPDPASGEYCDDCDYPLGSRGHGRECLGED